MEITFVEFVCAVIGITTLVVYFVMANNISKIKKKILEEKPIAAEFWEKAKVEKYIGNKDKAREYLLRAKYRYENEEEYLRDYFDEKTKSWGNRIKEIDKLLSEL